MQHLERTFAKNARPAAAVPTATSPWTKILQSQTQAKNKKRSEEKFTHPAKKHEKAYRSSRVGLSLPRKNISMLSGATFDTCNRNFLSSQPFGFEGRVRRPKRGGAVSNLLNFAASSIAKPLILSRSQEGCCSPVFCFSLCYVP